MSTRKRFRPKKAVLSRRQRRNIARWIKALRSGEYAQTIGDLQAKRDDGQMGWCCLGVLCDVTGTTLDDGVYTNGILIHPATFDRLTGLGQVDPGEYKDLEGSLMPVESIMSMSYLDNLADVNDSGGTFNQIATYIERRAEAIHPGWREGL